MTSKEIEELQEKVYGISNSMLPLNMFFNDIRDNPNENYDKELAYEDLEIITNHIINTHNKLEKLEKVIEVLKDGLGLDLEQFFFDNELMLTQIKTHFESVELTKEEYDLLKEIFAS